MKMKIRDLTYRAPLAILVETEMVGKYARKPKHTCHLDGFQGTRGEMRWHIKIEHKECLEVA